MFENENINNCAAKVIILQKCPTNWNNHNFNMNTILGANPISEVSTQNQCMPHKKNQKKPTHTYTHARARAHTHTKQKNKKN